MSEMADAIRELILEKGFSEDSVKQIIEKSLKSAYKKTYGTDENAIVKFNDDMSDVSLYSRKVVIDGVETEYNVTPSLDYINKTIAERCDPNMIFAAEIVID